MMKKTYIKAILWTIVILSLLTFLGILCYIAFEKNTICGVFTVAGSLIVCGLLGLAIIYIGDSR